MANLYFFTLWFPYKEGAEAFIENEISVASKYFDNIYIVPMYYDETIRKIPNNAIIIKPPLKSKKDLIKYGVKGLNFKDGYQLAQEFFNIKAWKKLNSIKFFVTQSLIYLSLKNSKAVNQILNNIKSVDVLYSYWGNGWGSVIPMLKELQNTYVSRFHRFDLYNERDSVFLFRKVALKRLNKAIFISKHGESYEHAAYPSINFDSIVSYLGTHDHGISTKSRDGKIRILSCSRIVPVKRVELIYQALLKYGNPKIEWTHIGDGALMMELQHLIQRTPHEFSVRLLGNVSNQEIMRYYSLNPVDLFINVSSSEGLPVSIMEAISFNIPIVATNVGGTSEIVNPKTGVLIEDNPALEEICEAIKTVLSHTYSPREFWEENFNAEKNYHKFYQEIQKLNKGH